MTIQEDLRVLKKPIQFVISNRFTFGVPLEDIFPASDIHPQLKNLFTTIYQKCSFCNYDWRVLQRKLKNEPWSAIEKEETVSVLELCKDIEHLSVDLLFWALKSFLRCLPIPVFPFCTNGEFFNWSTLAQGCTGYTLNVRNKQKYLFMKILGNLLRLPAANLLLLDYFIALLRRLSIRDGLLKQRLNRKLLVTLVKYYAMALFQRGIFFIQKEETNYSPLLFYLVINWKVINYFIKQKKYAPITLGEQKRTLGLFEPTNKNTQSSFIKKAPLETIFDDEILEITCVDVHVSQRQDNLKVPIKTCTVIDSECQTDTLTPPETSNIKLIDASTQYEYDELENDVYYTPGKEESAKIYNSYDEVITPANSTVHETKAKLKPRHTINDKLHCLQSSESSHLSEAEDPYIYDDYGEQMLITTVSSDSFDMNDNDTFLSMENTKTELDTTLDDMKTKMSKLGWTYTPSVTANNCSSKVNIFSPRPFTETDVNLQEYKICFDSEDKKMNESNEEKIEAAKITVPSKSLRDILSSGSMRVKVEFLRIFGKGRGLKVKSNSCEDVDSKVKYQKMDSTRSNMF